MGRIVVEAMIENGSDSTFRNRNNALRRKWRRGADRGGDLAPAAWSRITLTGLDLDGVRVEVQAPEVRDGKNHR